MDDLLETGFHEIDEDSYWEGVANHSSNSIKEELEFILSSNPNFTKKSLDVYTSIHNDKLSVILNETKVIILNDVSGVNDELNYDSFSQVESLFAYIKQYIY
jgi:hypothetical protein